MHGWVRASLYALWPAGGLLALIERERAQTEARLHLTEVGPPSGQGRRSLEGFRGLSLSCGSATVLGAHPDMEAQDRRWNWPWLGRRRQ